MNPDHTVPTMSDRRAAHQRLRRNFRSRRRALDHATQIAHAHAMARRLVGAGVLLRTGAFGLYFARPEDGEIDTLPLLSRLWAAGRTVACPVVGRDGVMDFYRVTPDTQLVGNRYGILEPVTRGRDAGRYLNPRQLSVLCVPLVAFDDSGSRLGMGAGYYDRFLSGLPSAFMPWVVGLAHEVQRASSPLPRRSWDVPLDAVVTETAWQRFHHRAKV